MRNQIPQNKGTINRNRMATRKPRQAFDQKAYLEALATAIPHMPVTLRFDITLTPNEWAVTQVVASAQELTVAEVMEKYALNAIWEEVDDHNAKLRE